MSQRQVIGKRKAARKTRKPGRERREALVLAAIELLAEHDVEEISFRDVAARAEIPEGSAYHFFANRFDIFSAVVERLSQVFIDAQKNSAPRSAKLQWQELAEHFVDVGVRVYRRNPAARKLLIGGKTPPQVKLADRISDRAVAAVMHDIFTQRITGIDAACLKEAFYYFIEITDLILTLSMIEHGKITAPMISEAKRAGVGYLASYLE